MRAMLAARCTRLHFVDHADAAARLGPGPDDAIAFWGARPPSGIECLVRQSGASLLRIEDGFIRSVGLGSDLIEPQSIVVDDIGIYFDATQPSRLEHILNETQFDAPLLARAERARAFIVANDLTKYNIEPRHAPDWNTGGRRVVLVPGQVETDASIALGGTDVRTNLALLQAVRAARPEACIVYKPHPDVLSRNRRGRIAWAQAAAVADIIEVQTSIVSCIDACDELHTITSRWSLRCAIHVRLPNFKHRSIYNSLGPGTICLGVVMRQVRFRLVCQQPVLCKSASPLDRS